MPRYASVLVVLTLLCACAAFAQITFTFTSFDPPASVETHAFSVNNAGSVVGYYKDSSTGLYVGYQRSKTGTFSKPIKMAGDNLYATGLNDSGVISGFYYPTGGAETSFTLYKGQFTDFAYNGFQTQVDRINNNGDLTGIYVETSTLYPGFLYVKATNTTVSFKVPAGPATFAEGLNKKDYVVGQYTTIPYTTYQSFLRNPSGAIATFMFPGASQTYAEQINDCNVIAGSFADSSNVSHGFYGKLNHFTQLDYPGAAQTALDGINNHGQLVGSYFDAAGFRHGFIATPPTPSCAL